MNKRAARTMLMLLAVIIILGYFVYTLQIKVESLEQEIIELTKVPDGFNAVQFPQDAFVLTKIDQPIQLVAKEEKSLKTEIVSRGDAKRIENSVVTAYSWTGNKTAIGTYPVEGRTCAGPRWIPLGTVVYIEGVGERIVEDRTNIRYNGRYDVYMDSEDACWKFGKQNLQVEVLK